jgi:hypothetical protein
MGRSLYGPVYPIVKSTARQNTQEQRSFLEHANMERTMTRQYPCAIGATQVAHHAMNPRDVIIGRADEFKQALNRILSQETASLNMLVNEIVMSIPLCPFCRQIPQIDAEIQVV